MPRLYCGADCYQAEKLAKKRDLKEAGLVNTAAVARMLGRDRHNITEHYAGRFVGGARIGVAVYGLGGPTGFSWYFTRADIEAIRSHMREHWHSDPRKRGKWYHGRHKSTKLYGHLGKVAGIEQGYRNIGRPPSSTHEQKLRVLALLDSGMTDRAISADVYGDSRFYKRVQRIRNG